MLSNEHATIKSVVCQMSDVRNFAFFLHTAMYHERLLSTCGSGKRITGREFDLPLRLPQTHRQGGLSVGGTFKRSAQHGDYVVGTVRLFYEALHTGTLQFKFEVRVNE